jgi:hypothetical protein
MNWIKQNFSLLVWGIFTVFILYIVTTKPPMGLPFVTNLATKIPGLLGSLLVVSLFVERVIEVFVSIWQDEETDRLFQTLENFQEMLSRRQQEIAALLKESADPATTVDRRTEINTHVLPDKRVALNTAERGIDDTKTALVPKVAHTRRISSWVGMAVGVLAASVGFRFLEQIVNLEPIKGYPQHYAWFTFTDVLLTGTVLAGGSKAIHSIFTVYDSFMNTTTKKAGGTPSR